MEATFPENGLGLGSFCCVGRAVGPWAGGLFLEVWRDFFFTDDLGKT